MVKYILEAVIAFFLILILISQIILPLFNNKVPLFWFFRKRREDTECSTDISDLEDEVDTVVEKTETVKGKVEELRSTTERISEKLKNNRK